MAAPSARSLAADVLVRVAKRDAFAAAVLDTQLASLPGLDPRDRSLTTELVYGVLRTTGYLDGRLSRFAPRGLNKLDEATRAHLLIAAYQILFLDRIPAFAAVSEAVDGVRALRGARMASFTNAVLRRLSEEVKKKPRPPLAQAVAASTPAWFVEALARALGQEGALAFLSFNAAPPLGLRITGGKSREHWKTVLAGAAPGAAVELGAVSPLALVIRGAGDVRRLPGFEEGAFVVQEEGAQLVGLALGVRPGETVLDACAGRGNKTSLLAEAVGREGAGGAVDAADLHPQKLERLAMELQRVGAHTRATYAVDWTVGTGKVPGGYDRILVDAPCSGSGTLHRRPELASRRSAKELLTFTGLQTRIVQQAATRLRPGGAMIYAVCSTFREEAEDVLTRVLAETPELALQPFPEGPARVLAGVGSSLRLLPHVHGTDGYFLASLVRR